MKEPRKARDPWPRKRQGPLAWIRDHIRVATEASHFLSARLAASLVVWLLVGIALALPAGLFLLQVSLSGLTQVWDGRPGVSLYFDLGAENITTVADELRGLSEVDSVTVVTQEQALEEFQRHSGVSDALALLEANPLPASIRATMSPGASLEDLEALALRMRAGAGVSEVVVEKTWLQRVNDISVVVRRLGLILGALFGIGAVLVTTTSVRLAIESRLEELRVLKLVGATAGQMRRPFIYFGALYGIGGGIVAAMLLSLALIAIETPLADLLGSYDRDLELAGFDPIFILWLLGIGGGLGVTGALIAVRQRVSTLEIF
ncbi:MAG: permease-like cell division protein FtsX [Proteobacteria bacterium]|nr:permease-like cell division protein FtsX [Pseudomonadota bacterium]